MPTTSQRGDTAQLLLLSRLSEAGLTVLTPVCQSLPFDLGIYHSGQFYRVQVKRAYRFKETCRYVVEFCGHTRKLTTRTGLTRYRYTGSHTDFIVGVVVETGDCYCFPVEATAAVSCEISVHPLQPPPSTNRPLDPEKYKNRICLQGETFDLAPCKTLEATVGVVPTPAC